MRPSALLVVTAFAVACAVDTTGPRSLSMPDGARSFQRAATSFTIGPLNITGIALRFPDGRWQFRVATLNGAVTGDLSGTAAVTLNGNFDTFAGSGPAWGTVTITTNSGETWQGTLQGTWVTGLPAATAIQLLSQVILHGPNNQLLKAECDETTAVSETLACTGEVLAP